MRHAKTAVPQRAVVFVLRCQMREVVASFFVCDPAYLCRGVNLPICIFGARIRKMRGCSVCFVIARP